MLNQRHIDLLQDRGLDPELLAKLSIVSSEKSGGEWISIPYLMDGKVVNWKHRTIAGEKRFYQEAGAVKCFWNIDVLADPTLAEDPLFITEGEFDAITLMQCGYMRVLSVPDGAPPEAIGPPRADGDSVKYSYVAEVFDDLRDVKKIIIAADDDGPGHNLLQDLAVRLGKSRCMYLRYPKGCKDLNDTLMRYGAKGVHKSVEKAQWIELPGVYRMSELPPVPDRPAFDCGMPGLTDHWKLRLGDFVVVTGVPSHGKTTWVNDVVCHAVHNLGWPTCFASFEQAPQVDHRRNLRKWRIAKDIRDWTRDDIAVADAWIDHFFSFIVPPADTDATLEWVEEMIAAAIVRYGAKIVVLDPWNEMDHQKAKGESLTEYVGYAIRRLKRLAHRFGILLIVVAHPAKLRKDQNGEYPVPTLYDISDSAHWYNKADVGITVYRDRTGTEARIAKVRYHDIVGTPNNLAYEFDPFTNRFSFQGAV